jgi:hypothetical protein
LLGPRKEALEGLVPGSVGAPVRLDNLGRDSLRRLKDLPELDKYGLARDVGESLFSRLPPVLIPTANGEERLPKLEEAPAEAPLSCGSCEFRLKLPIAAEGDKESYPGST